MARCQTCGKSPLETALYRINKTGVEGVFRCKEHLPKDYEVDPVVRDILNAVSERDNS